MMNDMETYNNELTLIGGKDGPRYFHKGLMHALATIWIQGRPELAEQDYVKDLLELPTTKTNRKSAHPLQNMNNSAARAIRKKLPMGKLVKRWNKIGTKKRNKVKNKYVGETMKAFVKYLQKKVAKGKLVVNGLTDSAIEWKHHGDADDDNMSEVGDNNDSVHISVHESSPSTAVSESGGVFMQSDNLTKVDDQMMDVSDEDNSHFMEVSSDPPHVVPTLSPSAEQRERMRLAIMRENMVRELENMKQHMSKMIDEKICEIRTLG